jgi:hypothetical protein
MLIFADFARCPFALGRVAKQVFRWQRREGDLHRSSEIHFFATNNVGFFQFEPFTFDSKRMEEIEFKTFAKKD